MLLFERGVAVLPLKGILLQEVLPDGARGFQRQTVIGGQRVHTDQLDNLVQVCLQLKRLQATTGQLHPVRRDLLTEPRLQPLPVQRGGIEPVDGGRQGRRPAPRKP